MNLAEKKCAPCKDGAPPLSGTELSALGAQIDREWKISDGRRLEKKFTFRNFREALAFANLVGATAEAEQHHPEITIGWGRAIVRIWTHKIDGLTESDFVLAAKIDKIPDRSEKMNQSPPPR